MAEYSVTFARSARKELESLNANLIQRIFPAIETLAKDPRPKGCRKLRTEKHLWRIRVGNYRVIYSVATTRRPLTLSLFVIGARRTNELR